MKNTIKLIAFISIIFLLQSCKSNTKENNETNSLVNNETKFNAEEEFSNINNYIKKQLTDSVSNGNYQCWIKDGKIIKLNIVEPSQEQVSTNEDYYFKDNNVFAYKKLNLDNLWYEALILFNNSKIITENYRVGDVKTVKSSFENILMSKGLTIQNDIIIDKLTNKSKGLLTLLELSKRYGFNYKTGQKEGNPELQNSDNYNTTFQGQQLKAGEKIIKINWGMENKTNYTRDMDYSGGRYSSKSLSVPSGKKWILLYINEDFTFKSGQVVGSVPDLFIDNKKEEINNRHFSNADNINLSRAKDENFKYYSGSNIKVISSRTNGNGVGDNFIEYKGEIWFLEIND